MQTAFEKFWSLFVGRTDAFGTDEGGCIRTPMEGYDYWGAHWHGHLAIGVYPLVPARSSGEDGGQYHWLCKWGCVDLDVKRPNKSRYDYDTEIDADTAARNLVKVLAAFQVDAWVEVTKSHGRHVWVFAADWVPARNMRRALLVACQLAGVPPTEVNPKAERYDDPDTLGNYVRLPYVGDSLTDRYVVDYYGNPLPRRTFIVAASNARTHPATIAYVADLYVPPASRVVLGEGTDEYDGTLNDDVTAYIRTVLERGPTEHRDRSGWLWWLAGKCLEEDLTPECALKVIETADETHTQKYSTRKDPSKYYVEIVERVYK